MFVVTIVFLVSSAQSRNLNRVVDNSNQDINQDINYTGIHVYFWLTILSCALVDK